MKGKHLKKVLQGTEPRFKALEFLSPERVADQLPWWGKPRSPDQVIKNMLKQFDRLIPQLVEQLYHMEQSTPMDDDYWVEGEITYHLLGCMFAESTRHIYMPLASAALGDRRVWSAHLEMLVELRRHNPTLLRICRGQGTPNASAIYESIVLLEFTDCMHIEIIGDYNKIVTIMRKRLRE